MPKMNIDKTIDDLLDLFNKYNFVLPDSIEKAEGIYSFIRINEKQSIPAKLKFTLKNNKTYFVTFVINGEVVGKPSSRGVTLEFKDGSKNQKFLEIPKKIWKEQSRDNKNNYWIIVSDNNYTNNSKMSEKEKQWNILLASPGSLINMFKKYFTMFE